MSGAELRVLLALNTFLLLTMSVAMAMVMRGRSTHGVRLWVTGTFVTACSIAMVAARSYLPPFITFTFGNVLMVGGAAAQCIALRQPIERVFWLVGFAAYLFLFAVIYEVIRQSGNPTAVRIIFVSLSGAFTGGLTLVSATSLHRRERGTGPVMIAFGFAVFTVACIARAGFVAVVGMPYEYLAGPPRPIEILLIGLQIVTTIFSQFGFVSLIIERTAAERMRAREVALREEAQRQHMEAQNRELAQLLAERSDTLDLLSHEIRQPLNNASAALESLSVAINSGAAQAGQLTSRVARAARVINDITLTLNNVIAAATSLRDGIAPVRPTAVRLDEVAELALLSFPPCAQERVRRDFAAPVEGVPLEPVLAGLALRNLIDNALKHAPEGSPVTLAIRVEGADAVVEVTNNGEPLPPGEASRIFDKRFRGSRSRLLPGAGLGLYIVRRVAELHGGRAEIAAEGGLIIARLRLPLTAAS